MKTNTTLKIYLFLQQIIFITGLKCFICINNSSSSEFNLLGVSPGLTKDNCLNQKLIDCDYGIGLAPIKNKNIPKWTCQIYVYQNAASYVVAKGCLQDLEWTENECKTKSNGNNIINTQCSCVGDGCNKGSLSEILHLYPTKSKSSTNYQDYVL